MGSGAAKPVPSAEHNAAKEAVSAVPDEPIGIEDILQFHSVIRRGKPAEEVKALIARNPSKVNCIDIKTGNSPLHIAAQSGHVSLVKLLLQHKARVNHRNMLGNTPLHLSIGSDSFHCTSALVAAGADGAIDNDAGIPACFGTDGDKSVGANAVVCATNGKEFLEAIELLKRSAVQSSTGVMQSIPMRKVAFVQAGMRLKKELIGGSASSSQDRSVLENGVVTTNSISSPADASNNPNGHNNGGSNPEVAWTPKVQKEFKLMLEAWDVATSGELISPGKYNNGGRGVG